MDRYQGDQQICQRLKVLLARAGILVTPVTLPWAEYFPKLLNHEYSLMMMGWSTVTGETSFAMKSLLATSAPEQGRGAWNAGRYSNPQFDALLERANAIADPAGREPLLQDAMELAMTEMGVIPLHFQVNTWAADESLRYAGTVDENTLAMLVFPVSTP